MKKNQTDYWLSKISEDRWTFEDRTVEGEHPVSFVSKSKPSLSRLEEKLGDARLVRKKYEKVIERMVVAYFEEHHKEIRKKMKQEVYFGADGLEDLNRLYPIPNSKHYEVFDVETLFDIGTVHFTSGNDCVMEVIVSWDDCLIFRIENETVSIDHSFDLDDLY